MRAGERKSATAIGASHYCTGRPCVRGHIAPRETASGTCSECRKQAAASARSLDRTTRRSRAYRARLRATKAANPAFGPFLSPADRRRIKLDKARDYNIKRRSDQARRQAERAAANASRRLRKAQRAMEASLRRARIIQATPAWANKSSILNVYRLAEQLSEQTGQKHHVDHIIPLRGKTVCGLHVQQNLHAIPASINYLKSNRVVRLVRGELVDGFGADAAVTAAGGLAGVARSVEAALQIAGLAR